MPWSPDPEDDPVKSANTRRIFPRHARDLAAELEAVGCHPQAIPGLLLKGEMALFKLSGLSAAEAHLLKQAALSLGGDAAVHYGLITGERDHSDALLMLSLDRLESLRPKLEGLPFRLPELSLEIEQALRDAAPGRRAFRVGDRLYRREGRPYIMGILNVTPDSFSDGGKFQETSAALDQARRMVEEGADFIDVGGESTRPGADPVSAEEEWNRVKDVVRQIAAELPIPLSIDTTKASVARRALDAGARIINDISALRSDPEMLEVALDGDATLVLMHMQGEPRTMQANPAYRDLMLEIHAFLAERVEAAYSAGVVPDRLIVDPGIGFGKRPGDNFEILGRLGELADLGPILVGPSRKSFVGRALNLLPEERLLGTAAAAAVATVQGADILRVHDVKSIFQAAEIAHQCLTRAEPREPESRT